MIWGNHHFWFNTHRNTTTISTPHIQPIQHHLLQWLPGSVPENPNPSSLPGVGKPGDKETSIRRIRGDAEEVGDELVVFYPTQPVLKLIFSILVKLGSIHLPQVYRGEHHAYLKQPAIVIYWNQNMMWKEVRTPKLWQNDWTTCRANYTNVFTFLCVWPNFWAPKMALV